MVWICPFIATFWIETNKIVNMSLDNWMTCVQFLHFYDCIPIQNLSNSVTSQFNSPLILLENSLTLQLLATWFRGKYNKEISGKTFLLHPDAYDNLCRMLIKWMSLWYLITSHISLLNYSAHHLKHISICIIHRYSISNSTEQWQYIDLSLLFTPLGTSYVAHLYGRWCFIS